jgi:hypothetical protein
LAASDSQLEKADNAVSKALDRSSVGTSIWLEVCRMTPERALVLELKPFLIKQKRKFQRKQAETKNPHILKIYKAKELWFFTMVAKINALTE